MREGTQGRRSLDDRRHHQWKHLARCRHHPPPGERPWKRPLAWSRDDSQGWRPVTPAGWGRRITTPPSYIEMAKPAHRTLTLESGGQVALTNGGDRGQIKTRDRVRDLAEVYTHEREVSAMLDLIPDIFLSGASGTDIKFFEPACGSGNFLEGILRRKLWHIRFAGITSVGAYEHRLLRAVASIYGVDICVENVAEARDRIVAYVRSHYYNDANTVDPTDGFVSALKAILATNILHADFLTDAATTKVIDYQPARGGHFRRAWSMLDDSVTNATQPDLFHQEPEPKRDERPVHYRDLASTPDATRNERAAGAGWRSA